MKVVLYTDASHCPQTKVAACGYVLLVEGKVVRHQVQLLEDCVSGDGEFFAAIIALQEAYLQQGVTHIELNTDYRSIIIFKNGFKAKKKPMSKEYVETLALLQEEGIELKINHVKSHSNNYYNTKVDKSCRNILREYIGKK